MIVFGDRVRRAAPRTMLAEISAASAELLTAPQGIVRHAVLAGVLLNAGALAQGIADELQERVGCDDCSPQTAAAMRLVGRFAKALLASWSCGFRDLQLAKVPRALAEMQALNLPERIQVRTPEGFAFYAVYPEAYAQAALQLGMSGAAVGVIGLRSIGTVLAAIAAEALDAASPVTVRPVGHPFARTMLVSDRLRAALLDIRKSIHVVVDEGPGASGSSFGSVADLLEGWGVTPDRIVFLPSHSGPPGPMASALHLARWDRSRRLLVSLDALTLKPARPEHQLASWFADLVGPATAPLEDISGGAWRAVRGVSAPSVPAFERRKLLLRTESGVWLLKFAGLGTLGQEKLALARRLHEAGFTSEPIGLRHGFLIERWHEQASPLTADDPDLISLLGRYVGFRARNCPAGDADGASLPTLCEMARYNAAQSMGADVLLRLDPALTGGPRVRIDGRLHAWEWLRLPDRVLKTDALDHHAAHDLVGCQPIAWDIAGAIVEFDLSSAQADTMRRIVDREAGFSSDPRLVATFIRCYCAFQLGLWMHASDAAPQVERYRRRLLREVTAPPCPP